MTDSNPEASLANLKFGAPKEVWDITLDDMRKHPVWIDCMLMSLAGVSSDEDGPLGGTEASARPVLNSNNVMPVFRHATILLRVLGSDLWASATYNFTDRTVTSIFVYNTDGTQAANDSDDQRYTFEAVPRIDGAESIRFACDPGDPQTAMQTP